MVHFKHHGNFKVTEKFFNAVTGKSYLNVLDKYGQLGVQALAKETPVDTGATADHWTYDISQDSDGVSIGFTNTNRNQGVNIAILLRYGHGTGTGGYVAGRDFISPAIQPVFDQLAEELWKEVTGK